MISFVAGNEKRYEMVRRILFTILGALVCLCSTPAAMASEAAPEGIRADFFVASSDDEAIEADFAAEEIGSEQERRTDVSFSDFGLLPNLLGVEESESSVDSESEAKREQKRAASQKIFQNKCRVLASLSAEKMSKGVAKHPATQDAGQERTAAIRFLQTEALAC